MKAKLIALTCSCIFFSCASTKTEPQNHHNESGKSIHFDWKPNAFKDDFYSEPLNAYSGLAFSIVQLSDSREKKNIIGSLKDIASGNEELIETSMNVPAWCRDNLPEALKFLGIGSNKKGPLFLECELLSFNIVEEQSLHAEIELGLLAKKDNDILIWEGSVKGTSDLYVKPSGSDVYSECFSNALITTVYKLMNEPSFKDAVMKSVR